MEVKIGITDSPRELVFNSAQTPGEVEKLVTDALGKESGVLALTDEKGRRFLVQTARDRLRRDRRRRRQAGRLRHRSRRAARVGQDRVSGTCDSPPQANCTVPSTASSLEIGRSAFSQYRAQSTLMATKPTAIILARCGFQPGIAADQFEHRVGARFGGHLDLRGHLRFGDVVVLEDQPVALAVVLDEVEERRDRRAQPLAVVGGGAQGLPHSGDQVVDVALQHRQVQLEFRREVLVQNRFADSSAIGDLVHARGVIAAVDEYLTGGDEQLAATLVAGQPVATPTTAWATRHHADCFAPLLSAVLVGSLIGHDI